MYESLIRMLERRIARQESALADTRRELEGARAAAAAAIASTQKPLPLETPPKASKG